MALRVERLLGRWTERLIAVSDSEADLAVRLRLIAPERVSVIPNGIELDSSQGVAVDLRDRLGLAKSTPLVGSVARLVPQKAPEVFVQACAVVARHLPDVEFVLIGAGPQQDLVDAEVERADLGERWHQIRVLPDAGRVLGQLSAFVLLSRFEGCPYTPLEAMRAGTPVVLSRVVGSRDIVEDRVSGLTVAPEDPGGAGARLCEGRRGGPSDRPGALRNNG
jgi:glycosyltransferase involved in cell wall biosynthesis